MCTACCKGLFNPIYGPDHYYSSLLDVKVIRDREDTMHSVCPDVRDVFVCFVVDNARKGDMAVLDDNAYRFEHWQSVTV
jgi:hypothetical protein